MADKVQLKINRLPEVLITLGFKKSTLYTRIKEGLMVPPISLGDRAVGYLEHEIQIVLAAICSGKSEEAIKQLVTTLIDKRAELFDEDML
ncbi:MAG: helix-turn-helix transcriptional regulator [Thalassotalea sp.]